MVNVDYERELIQGFLAGAPSAYDKINSWISTVLNLRNWHNSIKAARDDIRQEVLIALTENFRNEKYRGLGLKTYVSSVTKFICLRAFDRNPVVNIDDQKQKSENPSALEELILEQDFGAIRDGLRRLSAKCRKILALRFYNDLGHNEIAKALQITVVTSRQWLKRCLDKLRTLIFQEYSM